MEANKRRLTDQADQRLKAMEEQTNQNQIEESLEGGQIEEMIPSELSLPIGGSSYSQILS